MYRFREYFLEYSTRFILQQLRFGIKCQESRGRRKFRDSWTIVDWFVISIWLMSNLNHIQLCLNYSNFVTLYICTLVDVRHIASSWIFYIYGISGWRKLLSADRMIYSQFRGSIFHKTVLPAVIKNYLEQFFKNLCSILF